MDLKEFNQTKGLSGFEADRFTVTHIKSELIADDQDLFETKWWDYRPLHPVTATMYFKDRFFVVAEGYAKKYIEDSAGIIVRRAAARSDIRVASPKMLGAWWRARQVADAVGCPYDVYITAALDVFYENYHSFNTTKSRKQIMPYGTQLYSAAMVRRAEAKWQDLQQVQINWPDAITNGPSWYRPAMERYYKQQIVGRINPKALVLHGRKIGLFAAP